MAIYHFNTKLLSRSSRNTVRAIAYRAGCKLYDAQTGQIFNYQDKPVQHVELLLPKDAPEWAVEIQALIKEDREKGVQAYVERVEAAEKRIDARVWRECEFALHRELTEEQNKTLAREFVQDQICGRGMGAQLNFHFDVDEETGEYKPHCHVTATTRRLVNEGLDIKKELDWDKKSFLFELREQWANYSNFFLKLFGHDIRIDHRSYKERGIEMEPQPKRGRGIVELEKRVQKLEGSNEFSFVTDKGRAFYDVQLRNLYRIIRSPEIVFDIVTKHHSTFMWADVQKKLHQYIDDPHLFNRVDAKLKNSPELFTLRFDPENKDTTVYTTRKVLSAEKSLIKTAEDLGKVKSHSVNKLVIEHEIIKGNEKLKKHGGLSSDQVRAIHHLVSEGQIKCVVGIAGAGKTTALGVCHEIWKAEGYAVYGLSPTGKAAQNLEEGGIPSTTLHKFLKSFEEGRCQYNEKSVLVLDEAGMVDMERFEKLLGTVKTLGVKLIVVGDGAQLQPVEAGPAFRLVTARLGKVELNMVVRQKEEWQKEATVLFGRQKTRDAIKIYAEKGYVHIIDEKLSSLKSSEEAVKLFETSQRVSSLIYREMIKDTREEYPETLNLYSHIKEQQDFERYVHWKNHEKKAAQFILINAGECRPLLEARGLDSLKIALVLSDKTQSKRVQREEATKLLKECKLDHLIGIEKPRGAGVDVRTRTKKALIQAWHTHFKSSFKENPQKTALMLAYSNRDVQNLNQSARSILKTSGHISEKEFTYTIKREIEDDFGRRHTLKIQKGFSKGDRIVFTKNKYWSGIRNGTMGTITELDNKKIHVQLDEGKEISFAPNLNPHFDQGWAITIHKSQGTTIDHTFVLASYEMTQNLAYVAMTRHREWVKVFGSSFDFWRSEKLPQVLSKSGEKLSAGDYLDTESLKHLMKKDDILITKIFQRLSNELEAIGAVTKEVFWSVADHFLGRTREKEIRILPESIREEARAEELFHDKKESETVHHLHHEHLHFDIQNGAEKEELGIACETTTQEYFPQNEIQPRNVKEYHMTAEFKKEILGEALYQKIVTKDGTHKSPQLISEELKRELLGEKLYNKGQKTTQPLTAEEMNKLKRIYTLSHIEEDHAHHEQDMSLSQEPPSRGRKR